MNPKQLKLPNGLNLILYSMSSVQSVSVYVMVGAGPRYETKKTAGLAHFLEHMLFEGTKKLPSSKDVSRFIEKVGGVSNAWTDKEHVSYYVKVQGKHLKLAIEYLSDILFNSRLDNEAIEKEKRVILEEYKRAKDNPSGEVWDLWCKFAWGEDQWLGRPTLGDEAEILSVNRNKLLDYLNHFYYPSNMVIAIVGNISLSSAEKYVNKYFGGKQSKEKSTVGSLKFVPKKNHVKVVNADTNQIQLALGIVTGITSKHKDRFVMRVIADILSTGASSRIFHKIVYEEGLAYTVGAYSWIFTETSMFCVTGGFAKKSIERGIRIILEELEKLKTFGIKDEELREAKEKDKAGLIFSMETTDSIGNYFASAQLLEKEIMSINEISEKIDAVTAEDIQRAAKQYFKLENLCLMLMGPLDKKFEKTVEGICKDVLS